MEQHCPTSDASSCAPKLRTLLFQLFLIDLILIYINTRTAYHDFFISRYHGLAFVS